MTPRRRALHGWLLAVAWPAAALAQPRPPAYAPASAAERSKGMPEVQRLERRFLQLAAAHLRYLADGSRIALARSANTGVRELATVLLARHRSAEPEVLRLLHVRGMAPPMLVNEHQKVLKSLARLQGSRLDRVYVEEVALRACQADIPLYEKMALTAEDPLLKAWAERQLPLLRAHLAKATKVLPGGIPVRHS
jgi:putative membrane protein